MPTPPLTTIAGLSSPPYARAGIPEVWIVTRQNRRIEAYTAPKEGAYTTVRHAGPGASIAPEAFPDVILEVDTGLFPADAAERRASIVI